MSRNASGTYTLPSGNPVISGTLIEASWANNTLSDLASAMTDSLSRSGQGGMTAAFRAFDGTSSVPGIAWGSETTTGWYRAGAGDMRLVVTGSEIMRYQSTGVNITGTLAVSGAITATGGVTGNASTATALQTARTIWGQSFNGTANVSGALTGVTDITASGNGSFGGTLAVTGAATFGGQTVTLSNSTAFFPQLINRNTTADANASYLVLDKIRGSSVVQNGDVLGNLVFRGFDGTQYLQGAYINAIVNAAPGTNDMPAALTFGVTADGGSGPSEGMRLTSTGLGIGTSSPSQKVHASSSGDTYIQISRTASGSEANLLLGSESGFNVIYSRNATTGNAPLLFSTGTTERMRLSADGNLGLGVTPKSGSGGTPAFEISGSGTGFTSQGAFNAFSQNVYYASGWKYAATGAAASYWQDGGVHKWFTAPSGTAGNAISFTQAMTLDASGNVQLGTTTSYGRLSVAGGTISLVTDTASQRRLSFWSTANGNSENAYIQVQNDGGTTNTGEMLFATRNAGGTLAERARIDSSGNLLVAKTTSADTTVGAAMLSNGRVTSTLSASNSSDSTLHVYSTGASAYRFYVNMAGTIFATSTSISGISDASLKENVRDLETGLTEVMALKPRRFDWKNGDAQNVAGFVAQEVEQVLPELVQDYIYSNDEEGNNIIKKSLKMGDILPTLVKAIQEQQAIINQLKADVAALKGA